MVPKAHKVAAYMDPLIRKTVTLWLRVEKLTVSANNQKWYKCFVELDKTLLPGSGNSQKSGF